MDDRPNIIMIQADGYCGKVLGHLGHPAAHTPNLDGLAARGISFSNAYCAYPFCVPSRSSMWTGKYVHRVETWDNSRGLPHDAQTFQHVLEAGGYCTDIVGRTDHRSGSHSVGCRLAGYTHTLGMAWKEQIDSEWLRSRIMLAEGDSPRLRDGDWVTVDYANTRLPKAIRGMERPAFFHVGFLQPHTGSGYRTNSYYLDMIDLDRVPMPGRETWEHPCVTHALAGADPPDEECVRRARRHYYAMIAELDAMVGEILDQLRDLGQLDTAYIVFLADHGEQHLDFGMHGKQQLYEGAAKVPLIIAGPDIPRGEIRTDPVSLIDIHPTLIEMAGIQAPRGIDGESLLPYARDPGAAHRGWAFAECHTYPIPTASFMFRRGSWKLIEYVGYPPQLFNIDEDPTELVDLASEQPAVVTDLRREQARSVDIEEIAQRADAWGKEGMRTFVAERGMQVLRETMKARYRNVDESDVQSVLQWAGMDETG